MRPADSGILPNVHLSWVEYIMSRIALGTMTNFQSNQHRLWGVSILKGHGGSQCVSAFAPIILFNGRHHPGEHF